MSKERATPARLVTMYERGLSVNQIAAKTGLSSSFIWERLRALNVTMREKSGKRNGRLGRIKQIHQQWKEKQSKINLTRGS